MRILPVEDDAMMAIVQAIAEKHGASISLDASPRLGGLRVTMALPG